MNKITTVHLRGNIPSFIYISDGKLGDVKVLDILVLEPGAFYITLLQILSVTLFKKMPLQQAFPGNDYEIPEGVPCNQLNLFDY